MTVDLAELFHTFTESTRRALATEGASAELSITGLMDNFISAAMAAAAGHSALSVVQQTTATQETGAKIGVPDFRINNGNELLGWVEFKAVKGKDLRNLTGHDAKQRDLFVPGLHNLIYTNGWQWELYQDGQLIRRVTFDPELVTGDVLLPPTPNALADLAHLLSLFTSFRLHPYDRVDIAVSALALRAKALKLGLRALGPTEAGTHLTSLRQDFKSLLYRNGQEFTWEKFVDSYVQIAAFGALLWRLEAKKSISLHDQVGLKPGVHPLLYQCLTILWSPQSQLPQITPLLEELVRTINLIPPELFVKSPEQQRGAGGRRYVPDPIVHAYEPFFKKYDQAARDAAGVFYTPVEIVQHIVSGVDELLRTGLGRGDGILDDSARFLDPATGTGTFLLGLANEIAHEAEKAGLPTDQVVHEVLTTRTSAFELFPGPYTIAHQRLETLLATQGATPTQRLPIYLTDTLAAPESGQLPLSGFGVAGSEIQAERQRADWLKTGQDILVILGNPPYERMSLASGGWDTFTRGLMQALTDATPAARRGDLKSATDLYVAFWMWALWALQDPEARQVAAEAPQINTKRANGILAYITNRTWIIGPSLTGLRSLIRSGVKEVWVCDLGGDARGGAGARSFAGADQNVFSIQTGVAIVWLVFDRHYEGSPTVRYRRIFGKKSEKLDALTRPFDASEYEVIDSDDAFVPTVWPPSLSEAPALPDLFCYEAYTGIQSGRDSREHAPWGIERHDVYAEVRQRPNEPPTYGGALGRWRTELKTEPQRREAWQTAQAKRSNRTVPERDSLSPAKLRSSLYRPLDTRYVYDDPAWIDWFRADLHAVYEHGPVPTLISLPRDFGRGPLSIYTELLPEQHAFKGKAGGKGVFPLWLPGDGRLDDGKQIVGGRRSGFSIPTLDWVHQTFPASETPHQDAFDYILAVLSAPTYAQTYWGGLEGSPPRVPLTHDPALAVRAASLGQRLREAWTKNAPNPGIRWEGAGKGPIGTATHSAGTIHLSGGRSITGVTDGMWNFEVSGYRIIPEWLRARTEWTATISQSKETVKTLSAVYALDRLAPELNASLDALTSGRR